MSSITTIDGEKRESPETDLIDILMTKLKNETDPTIINTICNQLNEIPNTDTCECCDNKGPLTNDDGVWCCQECIDNN